MLPGIEHPSEILMTTGVCGGVQVKYVYKFWELSCGKGGELEGGAEGVQGGLASKDLFGPLELGAESEERSQQVGYRAGNETGDWNERNGEQCEGGQFFLPASLAGEGCAQPENAC